MRWGMGNGRKWEEVRVLLSALFQTTVFSNP